MSKKIRFEYDKESYTLEYSRASIREMAGEGFEIRGFDDEDYTLLVPLFAGAFKMHHKATSMTKIDEIYGLFTNKAQLAENLITMYMEAYESLIADPEEDEKNILWAMSE